MLAVEDFVDIVAVAANLLCEPRGAAPLAFHSAFNDFTDMYCVDDFHKKSVNRFALNACYLIAVPLPLYLTSTKQLTHPSVNHLLLVPIQFKLGLCDKRNKSVKLYMSIIKIYSFDSKFLAFNILFGQIYEVLRQKSKLKSCFLIYD